MKIAVPTRNDRVDDHFGHCEYYTLFSITEDRRIENAEILASPAGCGCKSDIAAVLRDEGVDIMLAGNMGEGAYHILSSHGIRVFRGCRGDVRLVTEAYLSGGIEDSGAGCEQHARHHQGHNHGNGFGYRHGNGQDHRHGNGQGHRCEH